MSALRVVLITPGYAAPDDPVCLPGLRDFVRELSCSHEVTVVALRYPYERATYQLDGAEVIALGGGVSQGWTRLRFLGAAANDLQRILRTRRAQVAHGFWADEPAFLATLCRADGGPPVVASLAGGELAGLASIGYGVQRHILGKLLVGAALRGADVVTAGSLWLARSATVVPTKRTVVCAPLGVAVQRFSASPADEALPTDVVAVASDVPVKGLSVLVRAWRSVHRHLPAARLRVVGAGTRRLDDPTHGIAGLGEVPHNRIAEVLATSRVWVQASLHEAQSVALVEAAASGLAIVGTRVGLLGDFEPALATCVPADADALAAALIDALSDAERISRAGAAARLWALENGDLRRTTARFVEIYASLVDTPIATDTKMTGKATLA